jgi:hypothetical protein
LASPAEGVAATSFGREPDAARRSSGHVLQSRRDFIILPTVNALLQAGVV